MIQGQKVQVLSEFHLNAVLIRDQELNFFMSIFEKLITIAGFLASFAASGLLLGKSDYTSLGGILFALSTSLALGLNILVLTLGTICRLWGPGRALRGEGIESISHSISVLEVAANWSMLYFDLGLFCYFLSSITAVWQMFTFIGATVLTAILTFAGVLIYSLLKTLKQQLTPPFFVSGNIKGNPFKTIPQENNISAPTNS